MCYNCDEKYGRRHNRVCKRLFLLDSVEEDDAVDAEGGDDAQITGDALVFSLHAVAGVRVGNTIQVRVQLGTESCTALLDTGSTHNFIVEAAALRTGLPL